MGRKRQFFKSEEKPVDYLDDLVNSTISQPVEIVEDKNYMVKVTHPSLRIRRAPNGQAEVVGFIRDQGTYKILDEVNGFGKLDEDKWIMLSYTQIV